MPVLGSLQPLTEPVVHFPSHTHLLTACFSLARFPDGPLVAILGDCPFCLSGDLGIVVPSELLSRAMSQPRVAQPSLCCNPLMQFLMSW